MTERDRWLANAELRGDGVVPCQILGRDAENWGGLPPTAKGGRSVVDAWGCTWRSLHPGLPGQVVRPALADLSKLWDYRPPDVLAVDELGSPLDWPGIERRIRQARKHGRLAWGHAGRFHDRVRFLRGFEDFMADVAEDAEGLRALIHVGPAGTSTRSVRPSRPAIGCGSVARPDRAIAGEPARRNGAALSILLAP